jgi:hypothetical protein
MDLYRLRRRSANRDIAIKVNDKTFRHAAAIALLGWYLMVPPAQALLSHTDDELAAAQKHDSWGTFPEFNLPIAKWDIYESYDSANRCKKDIDINARGGDRYLKKHTDLWVEYDHYRWLVAKCISSDDPRLPK